MTVRVAKDGDEAAERVRFCQRLVTKRSIGIVQSTIWLGCMASSSKACLPAR